MTISKRSYDELFKFHCDLLDRFPQQGGQTKGSVRTIPTFPGKKAVTALTKQRRESKEHALAEKRLPEIATYMNKLIQLPANISQSQQVLALFDTSVMVVDGNSHGIGAEKIMRLGFLTKQGNRNKTWKRRHAVLNDDGVLLYYLDVQATVCTGQVRNEEK